MIILTVGLLFSFICPQISNLINTATNVDDDSEQEEEIETNEDTHNPFNTYQNTLQGLNDLKMFYKFKNDSNGLNMICDLIMHTEEQIVKLKFSKQTSLTDFFKRQ